jgi:hypothetical protein
VRDDRGDGGAVTDRRAQVRAIALREAVSLNLADAVLLARACPGAEPIRPRAMRMAIADFHAGRVPEDARGTSGTMWQWFELIERYDAEHPRLMVLEGGRS